MGGGGQRGREGGGGGAEREGRWGGGGGGGAEKREEEFGKFESAETGRAVEDAMITADSPDKARANSYSAPGQFTSCVILTHPPSHSLPLTPSHSHIWRWRYRNLISLSHGHCTMHVYM